MTPVPSIFVAIASYRDPECAHTVRNLFRMAAHPERIAVGICWQFVSPADDGHFQELPRPDQVRCIGYDARESLGACWAKAQAQGLWEGEEYLLMIDSHMRFAAGWDASLIRMLGECPSRKAILSTYPAPYVPPDDRVVATPQLVPRTFDDGLLVFGSIYRDMSAPLPGALIAAGFLFTTSDFLRELPHDPYLYFTGEEIALSVRAWTWGWDVFTPHRCVVHHQSERPCAARHWDDNARWLDLHRVSSERVRHLLGLRFSVRADVTREIGIGQRYGLGHSRDISSFERFVGVSLRAKEISPRSTMGEFGMGSITAA